jgi:dTDP-4-dehydrorhamnose reductase
VGPLLAKVVAVVSGTNHMVGEWFNRLESGTEIRCARDQVLSPLAVDDAVTEFIRLAESGRSGVFHVCGPRPITRLDLLQLLVKEITCYRELQPKITPCSLRDFNFAEPRPLDTSMSPRKLYAALGRHFDDPREICRKAAAARYGGGASRARATNRPGIRFPGSGSNEGSDTGRRTGHARMKPQEALT